MKELPNSKTSYEIEKIWKRNLKKSKKKKKKKDDYKLIVIFSILGQFGTNRKPEIWLEIFVGDLNLITLIL